jgi:phosphatidylglycerol---prolipoprotein diacylglyceryl transferase
MTLLSIIWDFDPLIFPGTQIPVRWYGVLFALSFVVAYLLMSRMFRRQNLPIKHLDDLTFYIGVGTVLGARLGHCLFYEPEIYLAEPHRIFMIWEGGLASHGAALGILAALWLFVRRYKYSYLRLLDMLGVVIPLSGAFVRLGNLANSEIYGNVTSLPWGFEFRKSLEFAHRFEAHHPTQLYEAIPYMLITLLLWYVYHHTSKRSNGYLFGLFLVLLFVVRFIVEFVKEPQVAFETTMSLNMGQWLSVPFIVAGGILMFVKRGRADMYGTDMQAEEPIKSDGNVENLKG